MKTELKWMSFLLAAIFSVSLPAFADEKGIEDSVEQEENEFPPEPPEDYQRQRNRAQERYADREFEESFGEDQYVDVCEDDGFEPRYHRGRCAGADVEVIIVVPPPRLRIQYRQFYRQHYRRDWYPVYRVHRPRGPVYRPFNPPAVLPYLPY